MYKMIKNGILVIAIVAVLLGVVWFVYDIVKTEPVDANSTDTNLADENKGLDNLINELFTNVETNQLVENDSVENEEESKNKTKEDSIVSSSVTSKEEKAIELVKEEWGGTDGVYFSNESIDSQGRYIVSVRDRGTTNSLAFFIVDVNTGLVTKQ